MDDLVYILAALACIAATLGLVRLCDALTPAEQRSRP